MGCRLRAVLLAAACVLGLVEAQRFREDGKCGPGNLATDGLPADCEHIPPFPTCCQKSGHCGWDCDDVAVPDQPGRRPPLAASVQEVQIEFESNGQYRSDGRCGPENPLEDGSLAECDPNSAYYCCSAFGFCGSTQEHCFCETCVNYRPVSLLGNGKVRSDRRCGADFPLEDGSASECDGNSANHCCSKFGYCGPGPDHCDCVGCVDFRSAVPIVKELVNGKVRADRRCGLEFPLPDGGPSECDPNSDNYCCSKWGYCGPGAEHCSCPTCVDYRSPDKKTDDFIGPVRKDRRCGPEFPQPNGKPSECDPNSANFCCSKWGYCGGDEEHCDCPTCFNYKLVSSAGSFK